MGNKPVNWIVGPDFLNKVNAPIDIVYNGVPSMNLDGSSIDYT